MVGRGKVSSARLLGVCTGVVAVVVLAAGCSSTPAPAEPQQQATGGVGPTTPKVDAKPVAMALTPADRSADVAPGEPVLVHASGGKLTDVVLAGDDGAAVAGQLVADGTAWRSTQPLGYGKSYSTKATGVGSDGKTATATSSFSTAKPRRQTSLSISPLDGQTVGVGQPLIFIFDSAVDKNTAMNAIAVTTSPLTVGDFYWMSDKEVHWRPKEYWKPGTKITIDAAIYGKDFGNGIFGKEDRHINLAIGDSVVSVADGQTHQMVVTINGKVARTIPISMGKPGHETPVGTYVLMSENTNYIMDSSTYGVPADSPGGYRTKIAFASRMSNSGVFYHSAPWSVRQQGSSNVSHGCLNMSTENAKWMQDVGQKGDIVIVQNSGGPNLQVWDGLGDWQIPWPQWLTHTP
jgi:lipoprotein-anchoring transpeptidase ErfK/SrfK